MFLELIQCTMCLIIKLVLEDPYAENILPVYLVILKIQNNIILCTGVTY
jgi:hypothetical protein